jgi:hypothetical protein
MRVPLRRPPSALEQLLGRRRARMLRRRLGVIALEVGVSLLKPRTRLAPFAMTAAVVLAFIVGFRLQ